MLVAAHLDLAGVEEVQKLAHRGSARLGEREAVAVPPEFALRAVEFLVRQPLLISLAARIAEAALRQPGGG